MEWEGSPDGTVQGNLHQLHRDLREQMPEIHRFAIALYDAGTDKLETFVHSTLESNSLVHYEARLADVPSLAELALDKKDRNIADMAVLAGSSSIHSRTLLAQGFKSSYTKPFYNKGNLCGFLFFDAVEKEFFTPSVLQHLSIYAHLAALMVINALAPVEVLRLAVSMVQDLSHYRDIETGAHIDRMSRFAHLIAMELAGRKNLSDEFVKFLFLFAPLHDVGKIAIPDSILLKEGKLSPKEMQIMHRHVDQGGEIVKQMARIFSVETLPHMEVLYNIVTYHHEEMNGNGYPEGLRGEDIPLEARIITVADVFDALTSDRPYKRAWSNTDALSFLDRHAGTKFDGDCVRALNEKTDQIEEIQRSFIATIGNGFREGYTEDI